MEKILCLLSLAIQAMHTYPVLAANSSLDMHVIYNGWYLQTHDDGNGQLTARLYGEYANQGQVDNIASYRCEKNQIPFLRIVLPNTVIEQIRKAKNYREFYFTDSVTINSKRRTLTFMAWYSSQVRGLTIKFYGDAIESAKLKRLALLSDMADEFTIKLPIKGVKPITYQYATHQYADAEVADLAKTFGREFVLQNHLEFLSACE